MLTVTIAAPLGAQITATPSQNQSIEPAYRVATTTERINVDGRLDESAWQHADSIFDFRQREPLEGAPSSERTVVKIIRDASQLYVAVRAYDTEMSRVRSAQLRRDADLSSDDNITLLIDSYHDRRGAFMFATNPNGAMWDAQIVGLDNVNDNWNGIWNVAVSRDSASWAAEFAIPLQTLRFNPAGDVIGLNVRRTIRRKNEEDLWRSWHRTEGLTNLANTADVSGFGNVGNERPVELYPYALGRVVDASYDSAGGRLGAAQSGGKAGIDAKLGLTPR
ncbi:MAG: carbohydrate binding family 9 domain-containing protein [Gemmatimonadaceae bacterium]